MGELEEPVVDVVAGLPTDPQPTGPVEPGDRGVGDPPQCAESRTVLVAAPGDPVSDRDLGKPGPAAIGAWGAVPAGLG